MSRKSSSIISGQLYRFIGWYLFLALGVWLALFPSRGSVGEGVTGLDVEWGSKSRPSSSSIALLLHGFRFFGLSTRVGGLFGGVQDLVRLVSVLLKMSDASDGALLPALGLVPLPDFWFLRLVLLARDWYS